MWWPGVITVLLMGTWVATNSMGDWWVCLAFGILGFWMKQGGWPRPPLILALVLGGLMENNFQLTTQIYGDYEWLYNRPIVVVIEILVVATIVYAIRGRRPRGDVSEAGEGAKLNPVLSIPLAGHPRLRRGRGDRALGFLRAAHGPALSSVPAVWLSRPYPIPPGFPARLPPEPERHEQTPPARVGGTGIVAARDVHEGRVFVQQVGSAQRDGSVEALAQTLSE